MEFITTKAPYSSIRLAKRDFAYIQSHTELMNFVPFSDSLEGLRQKIQDRAQFPFFRKDLLRELLKQYATLPDTKISLKNIDLIKDNNTFTVTTAHQPSLFTGPLYVIYKAASCINLANQLQREFPAHNIIPTFVLGAEDHDFEEINHLHLYNKVVTWNQKSGGPTGSMATDGISPLIEQVAQMLPKTTHSQVLIDYLKSAFDGNNNFAQATQAFLHRIFGQYGLIVLQMNAPELKKLAIPIFRKEILEQPSFKLVNETIADLKQFGFKAQAKPRALNLFYMRQDTRQRIVFSGRFYEVLGTDIQWSADEIIQELEEHPEYFSPNVITRPLYQEFILPNIAYIGGGGELAYWQERYSQFQVFGISYPVLIRRNSALWVDTYTQKQLAKTPLNASDLLLSQKELLFKITDDSTDLSVKNELAQLDAIFDSLAQKADLVDGSLRGRILAEKTKQQKAIAQIESKLHKAFKQKHQNQIQKIEKLQNKLFPQGGLQERHDNFLPIYAEYGQAFIDYLVEELNPLDKTFRIIEVDAS